MEVTEGEIITVIHVSGPLYPTGRKILEEHQCTIQDRSDEHTNIILPKGSRKYRLVRWNTLHETRYRVVLPDGYVLVETHQEPLDRRILGFYPTEEERAALEKEMMDAGEYARGD